MATVRACINGIYQDIEVTDAEESVIVEDAEEKISEDERISDLENAICELYELIG